MGKTVVFDFDGVVHSYISGWKGVENIPDPPVDGIKDVLANLHGMGYKIVIVSTRSATDSGKIAIVNWLKKHNMYEFIDEISKEKPPAICYVDDRAICFDGRTDDLLLKIVSFQNWIERKRS